MAEETVRVEVHDAVIKATFEPGGAVAKNAESVGRAAVVNAKALAPARTGALRASITYGRQPGGSLRYIIRMVASVPYARYVEQGTYGPIVARTAGYLRLAAGGGFPSFIIHNSPPRGVAGQRGQHFLEQGMDESLREHGY